MPKYKADKGRAFSYFSVVGKNYLILNNNNNYKKMKIHDDIVKLDYKRNVTSENLTENVDEFNSEFVSQMLEYWDNNLTNIFHRQKDILVADSVLELFRKKDYIPSDGYKRNAKGSLINRQTTNEQKKLKVKIIYATI